MLNIEKIENIIKSKYKDVNFKNNTFEFDKVKSETIDWVDGCQMIEYISNEKLSYIRRPLINNQLAYADRQFEIENNAIELKHLLDIKITKQDMIDWLETFTTKYNGRYLIPARECWTFYVYTSLTDIDGKKSKCFGLMATQYTEDIIILQAKKSQEYWRLYNIIKNLKG